MRYYVIADVHGFYTPMVSALSEAGFFDDPAPHRLIVLGDLFDRGREAVKVQQFISELMDREAVILIRGNHEDLFEEFVTVDEGAPLFHHRSNGTFDTALQLTSSDAGPAPIRPFDLAEAGRQTVFYRKILPAMRDYYETQHYIFVHGWIPCEKGRGNYGYLSDWRNAPGELWRSARWINGMIACGTVNEPGKTIVCGHWHASFGHTMIDGDGAEFGGDADFRPYYGRGIIAMDACTAVSGFVNCIVIEDE